MTDTVSSVCSPDRPLLLTPNDRFSHRDADPEMCILTLWVNILAALNPLMKSTLGYMESMDER